ncbi:hypothetical protein LCGC14_2329740 [marine sediment metagenome]|uniref:Uncharacterized protein n=1 Tax=marine sediment metagenome TaxID=412755 RepID=A0A0F9CFX6_9ZZZZ
MNVPKEILQAFEDLALAKSIVTNAESLIKAYCEEHGEVDHAGLWCGRRQTLKEVDDPDVSLAALEQCVEYDGMPLEEMFREPEGNAIALQKISKNMRGNKDWRPQYMAHFDYAAGEDGGSLYVYGAVSCTPVKNRPSEEKYIILEPGEEKMK